MIPMDNEVVPIMSLSENCPTDNQEPTFVIPDDLQKDDEIVVKMMTRKNNPFGLSYEERRIIYHWQKTGNQTEAYRRVMLSKYDQQSISDSALRKRVTRFYNTFRIREAMAASPGERGKKAREDFQKWRESQQAKAIGRFSSVTKKVVDAIENNEADTGTDDNRNDDSFEHNEESSQDNKVVESKPIKQKHVSLFDNLVSSISEQNDESQETKPVKQMSDRDKWLDSLNISENPSALSIYGTGQFLAYMAVREMMERQREIKERHISVLDKNGSVFTPTIISALKTAAAMVLPFAPAPTAEDRREMSKAAVLLGLMPDNIEESPDAYTAPPPVTLDVTQDD